MIKIIGATSTFLAGIFAGRMLINRRKRSLDFLVQYMEFILILKNEMRYTARPISEILGSIKVGDELVNCVQKCRQMLTKISFERAWFCAFSHIEANLKVPEDILQSIKKFGAELGSCDVKGQMDICAGHINFINMQIEKLRLESKKRENLPVIIGGSVGLAAALVLI